MAKIFTSIACAILLFGSLGPCSAATGSPYSWGFNGDGQLGDGTTTSQSAPVAVSGLSGVVAIAGGYYHNLALLADGTVQAWGYNFYGELGDGTTTDRSTPVAVSGSGGLIGLSGVKAIAGGAYHSLALLNDGTVLAWGSNSAGQLGDGTVIDQSTPVAVTGLSTVVAIAAGDSHSLALLADGTVRAWGYNVDGELGDGTTTVNPPPWP